MNQKSDLVYLKHILDAINEIENFTSSFDAKTFKNSSLHYNATIRLVEVIGEATKNISEKTRQQNKSIPWKAMAKMRDKLIHHYFGVDLDMVWLVATVELKKVKPNIESLIRDFKA